DDSRRRPDGRGAPRGDLGDRRGRRRAGHDDDGRAARRRRGGARGGRQAGARPAPADVHRLVRARRPGGAARRGRARRRGFRRRGLGRARAVRAREHGPQRPARGSL
ncbi:MAG: hypothetical protein AVDCRST_MAG79-2087, partial [uncultured Thermoleophilia bacterium]